ncbi:MAG TPA: DUF1549 domain-containing protein [Pirellulales bacterium]|nr:DUF1549 domain-containing protein [Pirellulales bacterium]
MTAPESSARGEMGDRPLPDSQLPDHTDLLLDVLLDEALGGHKPPDLSERIVQALSTRTAIESKSHQGVVESRPIPVAITTKAVAVAPVSVAPKADMGAAASQPLVAGTAHRRLASTRGVYRHWLSLAATVMVLAVGYWTIRPFGRGQIAAERPVAKGTGTKATATKGTGTKATGTGAADVAVSENEANDGHREQGDTGNRAVTGNGDIAGERNRKPSQSDPASDQPKTESVADVPTGTANESPAVEPQIEPAAKQAVDPDRHVVERDRQVVEHEPGDSHTEPITPDDGLPQDKGRNDRAIAASEIADSAAHVTPSAVTDRQVIAYIDGALREGWRDAGVRPSPAATDAEWCRRVFLDVIGRIPTIDELEAFLVDHHRTGGAGRKGGAGRAGGTGLDKRARLVDRLLNDDEYAEAYARHGTTIWTNLLIGRSGGMVPGSLVNREGLQQFLRRSFLKNKPYDQLALELISACGSNTPGEDDYNGAVNFVLDNLQENAATATAKTAQIFLGMQIQCTQCHNHPFNEWKQNRFWELNAFFRQTKAVPAGPMNDELRLVRLVDEDFAGEGAASNPAASNPAEAEIYYELRNGEMRVAYPVFVDGISIDPSGLVDEVNRRDELARLVVRSEYLGQAIVNRLWGHFFGYGFTKPVDDLGTHNPASHPELLKRLGSEFSAQGHDLKRLIRWITLSEAYSLSSKFGPKQANQANQADDPTLGVPPLFSHFYLRQMTAEQLYDSLLVATEAHRAQGNRTQDNYEQQQRTKDEWSRQFTIAFGTDDNGETTTFDGTITQALMMMNGDLTRRATSTEAGGFLSKVAAGTAGPAAASRQPAAPINHLYLAALGRKPSRAELQLASGLLTTRDGNAVTVLEDVWWALLNSNEFILNH